jgi:glycosyltransferase involved in cell wall biosynthesis
MRISYFFYWNEEARGTTYKGVFNKIVDQICAWQTLNCESRLFILTTQQGGLGRLVLKFDQFPICVRTYRSRLDQFKQAPKLFGEIATWQPDIIYNRYIGYLPALQKMVRSTPTVLEVNSDLLSELLNMDGYGIRYWYHRMTLQRCLKDLCGIVFVSGELSELPQYARSGKPSIVIANGIDLDRYPALPIANNSTPRLVFMGSMAPWHGIDKIVQLAHQRPNWQFDLIGQLSDETKSQLPRNVISHGFLLKSQYEEIFAKVDVAIGSLALHRNKMSEASPLKVREYLAYGIPTIIGYRDTDFPETVPFLLQLPNSNDNIVNSIEAITQFVEKWKGKRVPRKAIAVLDVHVKEIRRLEFFCKVARVK